MKIAIDYDGTYTLDPKFWDIVIRAGQRLGHEIKCVTFRNESERVDMPCDVIYTNRQRKKEHYDPDVWIDDMPYTIWRDE